MSAEANNENAEQQEGQQLQVHVDPSLEYSYRDFFSIFVGAEEVTIDLGNRHRGRANSATIQNHIVLSIQNAIRMQQGLARSIEEARKRMQEARENAQKNAENQQSAN